MWDLLLLVVALVILLYSVKAFIARDWILGIALLVLACLVGPGGVSILT